jgi:hypothetical protein
VTSGTGYGSAARKSSVVHSAVSSAVNSGDAMLPLVIEGFGFLAMRISQKKCGTTIITRPANRWVPKANQKQNVS